MLWPQLTEGREPEYCPSTLETQGLTLVYQYQLEIGDSLSPATLTQAYSPKSFFCI